MQPYFIPYAGYFRLFAAADLFVVYDCVQFPRRGWLHRNRLRDANGELRWLTLPLAKAERDVRIADLAYRSDAESELRAQAGRFSAFSALKIQHPNLHALALTLDAPPARHLTELLCAISRLLGFEREMILSSTLDLDPALRGEARIVEICRTLGARAYVNAPGGRTLYAAESFETSGVALRFLSTYPGPTESIVERLAHAPAAAIAEEIEAACALEA